MNTTFKQLLEITEIKSAQGRIEELDRFLDITRGFSLKCNAHLRVLTNLVNNLVDSEDWLELSEAPLRLPPPGPRSAPQRRSPGPAEAIAQSMKEDYEKISKHIESGKQTSEFLKEMLEKLLKAVSAQPQVVEETRRENTTQVCSHRHCHAACPPGCTDLHDNGHRLGEVKVNGQKDTPTEPTEAPARPAGGPLHQPLVSHSNPRTNLAESNILLGRDVSIDQLPRRKLSIQSDNKAFVPRSNPSALVRRNDTRVRELETQLAESQGALRSLQAEILSLRVQKDQLEESVRELIALPLVSADSERPSLREPMDSLPPLNRSTFIERQTPIPIVDSKSSNGLFAGEKRSLRRI